MQVIKYLWDGPLFEIYLHFAESNIGTSIVPRTMPGLDFPMLVVLIFFKKSSDFVTRRTKSGQPDETALYLQVI